MKKIDSILRKLKLLRVDLLLHFIAGLVIVQVSYNLTCIFNHPSYGGLLISFGIGVIIGALKELYDKYVPGHSVELVDFVATCCGSFAGSILMIATLL